MAQYLKPDTELGYIEDNADIECLKMNNLRHVILGCMLGDFIGGRVFQKLDPAKLKTIIYLGMIASGIIIALKPILRQFLVLVMLWHEYYIRQ